MPVDRIEKGKLYKLVGIHERDDYFKNPFKDVVLKATGRSSAYNQYYPNTWDGDYAVVSGEFLEINEGRSHAPGEQITKPYFHAVYLEPYEAADDQKKQVVRPKVQQLGPDSYIITIKSGKYLQWDEKIIAFTTNPDEEGKVKMYIDKNHLKGGRSLARARNMFLEMTSVEFNRRLRADYFIIKDLNN